MTMLDSHRSLEGQFDALGQLAPEVVATLGKWWKQKGKPVLADVASPRATAQLAALELALEACGPRLA